MAARTDKELEKLYYSQPKLARHLSVFGESIALTEANVAECERRGFPERAI